MTTTTTDEHPSIHERIAALPAHKARRVEDRYSQALAYVWGWEDAHGCSAFELPDGFAKAHREMTYEYVTEARCMLPSIPDHFATWLTERG